MANRTFSLEEIEAAMEDNTGFCVSCGAEHESCEPDARAYQCDACGAHQVYGAGELVIMGCVR